MDTLAEAPGGVEQIRGLILELAVRGGLVPQDEREGTADAVLKQASELRRRAIAEGSAPKPRRLAGRPTHAPELHEVPRTWSWALLDDLCVYIQRGKSPKYDDESPVRVVSQKCVQWSGFDITRARGVRLETLEKYGPERFLRDGDLLWNSTGTGTVGRVNIFPGAGGQQLVADSHVTVIRLASVHPYFAYLWLRSPSIQAKIDEMTSGTTKQQELNTSTVRLQPVPLPPVKEQHRIVAKVDELMGLLDRLEAARDSREATRVALRDAALAALRDADSAEEVEVAWQRIAERMDDLFTDPADVEPLRQTVFELAVRGRLVPQDPIDEPATAILQHIAAERARGSTEGKKRKSSRRAEPDLLRVDFQLPSGWACVRLATLITGTGAGWSPKCHPYPTDSESDWGVLKTTAVQPNCYIPQHHKALPDKLKPRPNLEVRVGDLLVTRAGPSKRVGVAAFVARTRPRLMLSDKIIRCSIRLSGARGDWLAMAINSGPGAEFLREKQTGMDAAQMNISQSRLALTPVLLPPLAEQHRILARIEELTSLLDRFTKRLEAMRTSHAAFAAAAVHHLEV